MNVTKVKCLSAGTTVAYETTNVNTPEHHVLADCPDRRNKKFNEAMEGCHKDGVGFLGLGKKIGERWTLTGLSVSRDKNGHRTFVYTGKLMTNTGETVLNTTALREQVDGESGETTLSDVALKRVEQLLSRAAEYVTGKREQGELALGEGEAAAAAGS